MIAALGIFGALLLAAGYISLIAGGPWLPFVGGAAMVVTAFALKLWRGEFRPHQKVHLLFVVALLTYMIVS